VALGPFAAAHRQVLAARPLQADDGCEYIIVLQQDKAWKDPDPLPELPPNAHYLRHPNECFDIGTVGWVLNSGGDLR